MADANTLSLARLKTSGRQEEDEFARDENDNLIRREKATREQFQEEIKITIDGRDIMVPKAKPRTDASGNPLRDDEGNLIPRATTIYDAAMQIWDRDELNKRIPILCHQEHMPPIGVCRVCSVALASGRKAAKNPVLVPACNRWVEPGMIVITQKGPDESTKLSRDPADDAQKRENFKALSLEVLNATRTLTELLASDHLSAEEPKNPRFRNELGRVAKLVEIPEVPRFALGEKRNPIGPGVSSNLHPKSRPLELNVIEEINASIGGEGKIPENKPYSSRSFQIDHDACILCDRCVRACSNVRPFQIIGHTGKGLKTRISFDLDRTMHDSNCVQCGECMISCPTGAIQLNRRVSPSTSWPDKPAIPINPDIALETRPKEFRKQTYRFLTADEMKEVQLQYVDDAGLPGTFKPLDGIPFAYRRWNEGSVRERVLNYGDDLCVLGEFGATAFLLKEGEFGGYFGPVKQLGAKLIGNVEADFSKPVFVADAKADIILGEMACMTSQPRTATLKVFSRRAVVIEITRNMLLMMQRNAETRKRLDPVFQKRAIIVALTRGTMFAGLTPADRALAPNELMRSVAGLRTEMFAARNAADTDLKNLQTEIEAGRKGRHKIINDCRAAREAAAGDPTAETALKAAYLANDEVEKADRERLKKERANRQKAGEAYDEADMQLYRVRPGEIVVAQDQFATDMYIVRKGFLKVTQKLGTVDRVLSELKQDSNFGEIALMTKRYDRVRDAAIGRSIKPGRRTATVTALDDAEVLRIPEKAFFAFLDNHSQMGETMADACLKMLALPAPGVLETHPRNDYLRLGLFQGQSLLVLDLESCTRCDECTRACADAHEDGKARLLREGVRFGQFLVATSCRSCHQPYCMDECPVDAIHRGQQGLAIKIEDHCIGCSLCERNCPYGSIQMVSEEKGGFAITAATVQKSVNCDLCSSTDIGSSSKDPYCVHACPHGSAHRVRGEDLLIRVEGGKFPKVKR